MLIVGLTGGLGTGKSTVAAMFATHGAVIIDADAISRGLLGQKGKCLKKVAKAFPGVILAKELDRNALANVVFQNSRVLKKLTDIIYPQAFKEVLRLISLNRNKPLIILDVPLLFESGWDKIVDTTVVVRASRRQQFERLAKRFAKADITRRLRLQMPMAQKLQRADIIIDNRGTPVQTRAQVDAVTHRLFQRQIKTTRPDRSLRQARYRISNRITRRK